MPTLTKRVQVRFSSAQFRRLRALAQTQGRSLGALVRQAVDEVYPQPVERGSLEAVRQMAALQLPVADWERMEQESAQGETVE